MPLELQAQRTAPLPIETTRFERASARLQIRSQLLARSTALRCCWRPAGIDRSRPQGSCKRLLALQPAGSSYCRNLREAIESEPGRGPRGLSPLTQTASAWEVQEF